MNKRLVLLAAAMSLAVVCPAGARTLIPGGQSIGIAVSTDGLMVTGTPDIGGEPSPARLAGIRQGDVICEVDGKGIGDPRALSAALDGSRHDITVRRGQTEIRVSVLPVYDAAERAYRIGAIVRQGTAGIGTLTFYDPATGGFGALGHAVTDEDTGLPLPAHGGGIYENAVTDVHRGIEGTPGELAGQFYEGGYLGGIEKNTQRGVFGSLDIDMINPDYPEGIETAPEKDIRTGRATIITTVGDEGPRCYDCEIVRLGSPNDNEKSFTLQITDDELLERTGGIVQGMSGSPVIQNGRLVGAITHVLINDPTTGYGIGIDRMLAEADTPLDSAA